MTLEKVEISDAAAVLILVSLSFGVISWFVMFMAIAIHLVRGGCL